MLNRFLDEGYVENSRFPRDLVKRFQNILKQINQNIKTNTGYARGTRSSNFSFLASLAQKINLFTSFHRLRLYRQSKTGCGIFYLCYQRVSYGKFFYLCFFFSLSMFMFNFLLVDSWWPFSSSLLHLRCLFLFLLVQNPISIKCAVW